MVYVIPMGRFIFHSYPFMTVTSWKQNGLNTPYLRLIYLIRYLPQAIIFNLLFVCVHVCAPVQRSQKGPPAVLLCHSPPSPLRQGLSQSLRLPFSQLDWKAASPRHPIPTPRPQSWSYRACWTGAGGQDCAASALQRGVVSPTSRAFSSGGRCPSIKSAF